MTVSTQTRIVNHSGNGVAVNFTYPFKITEVADLRVYLYISGAWELQTFTTHYTVSGIGNPGGGTVTFVTPPSAGSGNVRLLRRVQLTQLVDYILNDDFPAEVHEGALDKLTMAIQDYYQESMTADQAAEFWDALGRRIVNAGDPIGLQDVVTKAWFLSQVLTGGGDAVLDRLADPDGASVIGFVQAGANAVTRDSQSKLREIVSVKDFGAVGDGVTNDSAAILTAAGFGRDVFVPKGTYVIGTNITLTSRMIFEKGAVLQIANAVTVAFNGGVTAGVQQIFSCSGTGSVTFNWKYTSEGFPEWWGASVNDSSADCTAAINAAIIALKTTRLQPVGYYCASTVQIVNPHRRLIGAGIGPSATDVDASRIISTSATEHVMVVGPSTKPAGGINNFQIDGYIEDVQFTRSVAPNVASGCCGLLLRYTLYTEVVHCRSHESMKGFCTVGTCQTHIRYSYAFRSAAGVGGGADYFWGFYLNGNDTIGSGGNASVYLIECDTSCGGMPYNFDSSGVYLDGGFADVFLNDFESSSCAIGINVVGNSSQYGNIDLHIRNPIIDGYYKAGVLVRSTSPAGAIEITGGYAAPAGTAQNTNWGLWIENSLAAVTVSGYQTIGYPSAYAGGMLISGSQSVITHGNLWTEVGQPGVLVLNSSKCKIADEIKNTSRSTAVGAVQLQGTNSRIVCDCNIHGNTASGAFGYGYQIVGTTTTLSEFRCSGIDAAAMTGGASSLKLNYNGTNITSAGAFGTNNLAQGVMA